MLVCTGLFSVNVMALFRYCSIATGVFYFTCVLDDLLSASTALVDNTVIVNNCMLIILFYCAGNVILIPCMYLYASCAFTDFCDALRALLFPR